MISYFEKDKSKAEVKDELDLFHCVYNDSIDFLMVPAASGPIQLFVWNT